MKEDVWLEVRDLTVEIDGREVLSDVHMDLHEREVMTLMGPNGSGKTVLLRAILGRLPFKGSVRWAPGCKVGYLPQRFSWPHILPMTLGDFFSLKAGLSPQQALQALEEVGFGPDTRDLSMSGLSVGQIQRVMLAWALAGQPRVLLLDEPAAGMDFGGEETMLRLLSRLHASRGLAMLLVTHDLAVVHRLSTKVVCLNRRIICQGPPLEILTPAALARLFGTEVRYFEHRHP